MQIGLIADTHIPRRWKTIPSSVFEIFADCDLILHAGDLSELWILDQLSQCAPVIAVYGNDETNEVQQALPFLQTLSCAGHRLVLTHSHHPDLEVEMAQRQDDCWYPKLQYRADFGKEHGASIVITGHTHIPMQVTYDDVLLINPGGIGAGGWTKQIVQTVAILTLEANIAPQVQFIDINTKQEHVPNIDWDAGYIAASRQYNISIVADDFEPMRGYLMKTLYPQYPEYFKENLVPLLYDIWEGEHKIITLADVMAKLLQENIRPGLLTQLRDNDALAPYL